MLGNVFFLLENLIFHRMVPQFFTQSSNIAAALKIHRFEGSERFEGMKSYRCRGEKLFTESEKIEQISINFISSDTIMRLQVCNAIS